MKSLRLFGLGLGLALGLTASAQSYSYLTFRQADGTETSLKTAGLKLTFADGNLVATNGSETATFALSTMAKMYFSTNTSAIDQATTANISATIVNGTLQVNAPAGTPVSVYGLDGREMPHHGLTSGVYVVRVGQKVLKLMAK